MVLLRNLLRLIVVFILISSAPLGVQSKYNHNSITISEIKEKVDFKVLSPNWVPNNWTLEIKTYPWGEKDNITHFRLHFMDKDDNYLMIGIEEKKASEGIEKQKPNTEKININGNIGYFHEWANSGKLDRNGNLTSGGRLSWIQEGTYIEMDSLNVEKDKMIEFASSMK